MSDILMYLWFVFEFFEESKDKPKYFGSEGDCQIAIGSVEEMAVIEELHDCFIDFLGMVVVVFKAGNDNDPHFVLNIAELSLGCGF